MLGRTLPARHTHRLPISPFIVFFSSISVGLYYILPGSDRKIQRPAGRFPLLICPPLTVDCTTFFKLIGIPGFPNRNTISCVFTSISGTSTPSPQHALDDCFKPNGFTLHAKVLQLHISNACSPAHPLSHAPDLSHCECNSSSLRIILLIFQAYIRGVHTGLTTQLFNMSWTTS